MQIVQDSILTSLQETLSKERDFFKNLEENLPRYYSLVERAGMGELDRQWDSDVETAIEKVTTLLKRHYAIGKANFPDWFWEKPEGRMIALAQIWLYGNDLIDLPDAACILRDIQRDDYKTNNAARNFMNAKID